MNLQSCAETHEVTNQVPPLDGANLYRIDLPLQQWVQRYQAGWAQARLDVYGALAGGPLMQAGFHANENRPVFKSHDRYGHRIDLVEFHPAYHELMRSAVEHGIPSLPWSDPQPGAQVARAALMYLHNQAEAGSSCPLTMTYASVPALRLQPDLAERWLPKILAREYDPRNLPLEQKAGVTIGMAMTEKQGGTDVRANSTRAYPVGAGGPGQTYELVGHKWFCSAPMCDTFLTLAYAPGGLTCFILPRWLPDGTRNAGFRVMRLKDKMGDRSNASSEVEYHGALAQRLGEEGRGVATIIRMVQHTRLDCVVGSALQMRGALAQAVWHAAHRTAFQKRLIDQPMMAAVLADLAVESEAATALSMRLAATFDTGDAVGRLLTPVAKYWVCKRAPNMVYEAMEALGGAGYVETGPMPRLFRQSPLNAIWEGSGNVIALDVLRAAGREPEGVEALRAWLASQAGKSADYDRFIAGLDLTANEAGARLTVERLALAAQAATLLEMDTPSAEAFIALRLRPRGMSYGAYEAQVDQRAVLERAMPA